MRMLGTSIVRMRALLVCDFVNVIFIEIMMTCVYLILMFCN